MFFFLSFSFISFVLMGIILPIITDLFKVTRWLYKKFFTKKVISQKKKPDLQLKNCKFLKNFNFSSNLDREILKSYFNDCFDYVIVDFGSYEKNKILKTGHLKFHINDIEILIENLKEAHSEFRTIH